MQRQTLLAGFSNGTDIYRKQYKCVPASKRNNTPIKGSSSLYTFQCNGTADASSATVLHKFMQCYCEKCRNSAFAECHSRVEFGNWRTTVVKYCDQARRARTRQCEQDEPCQHCGSTDDGGSDAARQMLLCDTCDSGWHMQ